MSEIRFEIKKHLGVLSTRESGWTKEANIISWNDGPAKLDIRLAAWPRAYEQRRNPY